MSKMWLAGSGHRQSLNCVATCAEDEGRKRSHANHTSSVQDANDTWRAITMGANDTSVPNPGHASKSDTSKHTSIASVCSRNLRSP